MSVEILSISRRPTRWVRSAIEDYLGRFPIHAAPKLTYLAPAPGKMSTRVKLVREAKSVLGKVSDKDFLVVMDVAGIMLNNEFLARKLEDFHANETNLKLVLGGAEGLDESVKRRAKESWSVSRLILPHKIVQILVLEQLYRTYSISVGHPYHRR